MMRTRKKKKIQGDQERQVYHYSCSKRPPKQLHRLLENDKLPINQVHHHRHLRGHRRRRDNSSNNRQCKETKTRRLSSSLDHLRSQYPNFRQSQFPLSLRLQRRVMEMYQNRRVCRKDWKIYISTLKSGTYLVLSLLQGMHHPPSLLLAPRTPSLRH